MPDKQRHIGSWRLNYLIPVLVTHQETAGSLKFLQACKLIVFVVNIYCTLTIIFLNLQRMIQRPQVLFYDNLVEGSFPNLLPQFLISFGTV